MRPRGNTGAGGSVAGFRPAKLKIENAIDEDDATGREGWGQTPGGRCEEEPADTGGIEKTDDGLDFMGASLVMVLSTTDKNTRCLADPAAADFACMTGDRRTTQPGMSE
jgi:hypothetical protein